MTIAAGFVHRDGVLLCADTEEQQGAMKTHRPKLVTFDWKGRVGAFAFAGNSNFALSTVQKCKTRLEATSKQDALEVIEGTLTSEYTRLVFKHPLYGADSSMAFSLLIVIPTSDGGTHLFKSDEASLQMVEHFGAIGIGDTFARHLVGKSCMGGMSERRTLQLAAYMLKMTEENVPGCSRPFHIKSLRTDGSVADFSTELLAEYTDKWGSFYDVISRQLFFNAMDECDGDQDFEENVHVFLTGVREIRKSWRNRRPDMFLNPAHTSQHPRD